MKTLTVLLTITTLLLSVPFAGIVSQANAQTQTIATEKAAELIAADAGGTYIKGNIAPALSGSQIALPVIEEGTTNILGFIVADQADLVAALNAANLTEVAAALGAAVAGTVAGTTVATGVGIGTTTMLAVGGAAVIGLAVAAGGGGGGGGGGTTTTHHH
jgi:hypothetical protein